MDRTFINEEIKRANRYGKKCSKSQIRNANPENSEIILYTCGNVTHLKGQKQVLAKMWERKEPFHTADGNVNWSKPCGEQPGDFLEDYKWMYTMNWQLFSWGYTEESKTPI